MTYEYVGVVTPPKCRATWATSWGRLQGLVDFIKKRKTSTVNTTDGWLKLNLESCVIRQTRLLGALVFYSVCSMVFVNDFVVDAQFHNCYGRPFARVLYLFLMKDIRR